MVVLENATLCNLTSGELRPGFHVTIDGESIAEVSDRPVGSTSARRVDLAGRCLLPELIDAHYHATLTEANPAHSRDVPLTLMTARAAKLLRNSLIRGFT